MGLIINPLKESNMARNKTTEETDPEKLKMMMTADLYLEPKENEPDNSDDTNKTYDTPSESVEEDTESGNEKPKIKAKSAGKKKNKLAAYKDLFMKKPRIVYRRQRSIHFEDELYFEIKEIVQFTNSPISLPDFINNLVKHHLETYKEEIYEVRNEYVEYIREVLSAKKE